MLAVFDFMKQAIYTSFHGRSRMLRPSGNSSPNSDHRAGCHRTHPKVLTEAEVIEAETELKALQRYALEVVDPEANLRRGRHPFGGEYLNHMKLLFAFWDVL